MASISAKDTKPELALRKSLHQRGYRYRLHVKNLPGKPDLVFHKFNAILFINGCFWHGHDCRLFRIPGTNQNYWTKKFDANRIRDGRNKRLLLDLNWRVLTVWECSMRGRDKLEPDRLISTIEDWMNGNSRLSEVRGSEAQTLT